MADDIEAQDWLWDFFEGDDTGTLVDVGAGNGIGGSLSYRFLTEKNWSGVLIDPLPMHAESLRKVYRGKEKVNVEECAIMDREGFGFLYPFQEVSTTRKDWALACSAWWSHVDYKEGIIVEYKILDTLLDSLNIPDMVDFLKVDTEGVDEVILGSFSWHRKYRVICVETLDMLERPVDGLWQPKPSMKRLLEGAGYKLRLVSKAGNAIFERTGK